MPAPLELEAAREMVRAARAQGISLTGPEGLLKQLTKTVVEVSLEEEMTDHLGYPKHETRWSGVGEQPQRQPDEDGDHRQRRPGGQIDVPRDRAARSSR